DARDRSRAERARTSILNRGRKCFHDAAIATPCAIARSRRFPRGAKHEIEQTLEIIRRVERDSQLSRVLRVEMNLRVRLQATAKFFLDARDLGRSFEFRTRRFATCDRALCTGLAYATLDLANVQPFGDNYLCELDDAVVVAERE